ncbi:MAG TPA: YceI family protein [Xanthomonadaceae bacterium]|nr:YceI family protein [Xanthomonadaceae bacterium]
MIRISALILVLTTQLTLADTHAADRWEIDKAHTQVLFTVDHLGFTDLTGQFRMIDGTLHLDTDDWTQSSVTATIEAASVDMNHDGINRHLRNPDFFDVETHATLEFRSTSVKQVGENRLELHGELTMIGKTLPVRLDVTLNKLDMNPGRGTPRVGFRAEGSLKRSDWGMSYGVPNVGDEIAIVINLEARIPAP